MMWENRVRLNSSHSRLSQNWLEALQTCAFVRDFGPWRAHVGNDAECRFIETKEDQSSNHKLKTTFAMLIEWAQERAATKISGPWAFPNLSFSSIPINVDQHSVLKIPELVSAPPDPGSERHWTEINKYSLHNQEIKLQQKMAGIHWHGAWLQNAGYTFVFSRNTNSLPIATIGVFSTKNGSWFAHGDLAECSPQERFILICWIHSQLFTLDPKWKQLIYEFPLAHEIQPPVDFHWTPWLMKFFPSVIKNRSMTSIFFTNNPPEERS